MPITTLKHVDVPDLCGLSVQDTPKQQQQPTQQCTSPPQLQTKEESAIQTPPMSTYDTGTFHRLSEGEDGRPRGSPPPRTLMVDPELAPVPAPSLVDIPRRLMDPDLVSNPMTEVRVVRPVNGNCKVAWYTSEESAIYRGRSTCASKHAAKTQTKLNPSN